MSMRDGPNSPLSHTAASLSSWLRFVLVGILFFWLSCAWSRAAKRDSPLSGRVGAGLGGVFLRLTNFGAVGPRWDPLRSLRP